jgi:hypothetical protein
MREGDQPHDEHKDENRIPKIDCQSQRENFFGKNALPVIE